MIIVLFAYLVGFSIVNLIDEKLGNVEIKIPKIDVPHIKVSIDGKEIKCDTKYSSNDYVTMNDINRKEYFENESNTTTTETLNIPEGETSDISLGETANDPLDVAKTLPVDEQFKLLDRMFSRVGTEPIMPHEYQNLAIKRRRKLDTPMKVGCNTDADCNVVWGDGKNTCKRDGSCHCVSGSGTFCQYGPTNYKDPSDMTDLELKQFRYKYRNDMTLQDYKNWLMLFKNNPQHLREHHRENLAILLRGGMLTEKDIPAIRIKPPMDPADYFKKMYEGGKISVHFPSESETGALLPANHSKYDEFLPPEKVPKSWITGIVDLYKRPLKDDAKAVNFYLRPEVTVGVERELVGEEYLNWVKRHHNLADIRRIQIRRDESINTFQSADQNVTTA